MLVGLVQKKNVNRVQDVTKLLFETYTDLYSNSSKNKVSKSKALITGKSTTTNGEKEKQ